MRKRTMAYLGTCVLLALLVIPPRASAEELAREARKSLRDASRYLQEISINGGYPSRYSGDLQKRYWEGGNRLDEAEIYVQHPGTPSVGQSFLRAYRATRDNVHLQGALRAGRALAWGQKQAGGWDYVADVAGLKPDAQNDNRAGGSCTFDDNVTQGALMFLMDLDAEVDTPWLTRAVERGLDFMLDAQFDNGAWAQRYPLAGGYHDYYTFNDAAINDCIKVLMRAHRQYGDERYLEGVRRAGDFLIQSQGEPPQAGWAQQYNHDTQPAWARGFEPPGYCSAVTARTMRTLVNLYVHTGDERYLAPVPPAIEWLQRSKLGDERWARLYEVGSNRPVYGDRNDPNKKHYDYSDISEEERNSYAWQGSYGIPEAIEYYRNVKEAGATKYRERREEESADVSAPDVENVRAVMKSQDEEGRWVRDGEIRMETFIDNMRLLSAHLRGRATGSQ